MGTYLVFSAPGVVDDILVDVSYKQFWVVSDWVEEPHFEACEASGEFREFQNWFVGTDADFQELMSKKTLRENMRKVSKVVGRHASDSRWIDKGELAQMHDLRQILYGLQRPGLRQNMCGGEP